jgi:hypothetical protein
VIYADTVGLEPILERILQFRRTLDPSCLTPAPAARGRRRRETLQRRRGDSE